MFDQPSIPPSDLPQNTRETRERLLDAAGRIFADKGFKDATIREICREGGANIAAVNYHFGDKHRLYSELLRYADRLSMARHPEFPVDFAAKPPRERLIMFVRQFIGRAFDDGRPAWHERLMAREMVDPTPALGELVEQNIMPRARALRAIVREIVGPGATEEEVQLGACSVVAQCLIYHNCRPMMTLLMPQIRQGNAGIDAIVGHISLFSLAGLDELRAVVQKRQPSARGAASEAITQANPSAPVKRSTAPRPKVRSSKAPSRTPVRAPRRKPTR